MLALGTLAQTVTCTLLFGIPFLLPYLRRTTQLSLAQAGALAAAPSFGLVATLVLWGVLADRRGERAVLTAGVALTGAAALLAAAAPDTVLLAVALVVTGAFGSSPNAASGRLVMAWFPTSQRGLAMGVRQMGQPLGVATAALVLPPLAEAGGLRLALGVPAGLCLLTAAALGVLVRGPEAGAGRSGSSAGSPKPAHSPYRTPTLWRIHAASGLLVVPQFATALFAAEYLVSERGWDATSAGRVLALVSVAGAFGRLAVGRWSDVVGSRIRPMRQIAVGSALTIALVGLCAATGSVLVLPAIAAASIVAVADNGLGFTATAELAGLGWSGRALGIQNTTQNLAAFATGPLVGALAGASGFGVAFAACAIFPLIGAVAAPVSAEARVRLTQVGPSASSDDRPLTVDR